MLGDYWEDTSCHPDWPEVAIALQSAPECYEHGADPLAPSPFILSVPVQICITNDKSCKCALEIILNPPNTSDSRAYISPGADKHKEDGGWQ